MIKVSGRITLSVDCEVNLNMTDEQFGNLSDHQINQTFDDHVEWLDALRNSEIEYVYVREIEEVEE